LRITALLTTVAPVRRPRDWAPGAIYHLSPSGNGDRVVFVDDVDRRKLLGLLAEAAPRYDVIVIGYCLMGNHFHLLVICGDQGLSRFAQFLLGRYSRWFNRRHALDGGVFETRFHATRVAGDSYLWTVAAYIDLNPVKDGFVDRPEHWTWSSYRGHIGLDPPASFLDCEAFGQYLDPASYQRFVERQLAGLKAVSDTV
jgi:REP element-mobilizing transposase RayT